MAKCGGYTASQDDTGTVAMEIRESAGNPTQMGRFIRSRNQRCHVQDQWR